MILPYFTTNEMTPTDVHNLGKEQLDKLYPLVSKMIFSRVYCYLGTALTVTYRHLLLSIYTYPYRFLGTVKR